MNRSTLILIIVVLILAIGGVGAFLFFRAGGTNTNTTTNTTTNTQVSTNINGAGIVGEDLGTNQIDQDITYRGAAIPVDYVQVTNAYTGYVAAPAGKKYVVVYLQDETLQQTPPAYQWIGTEAQLVDSEGRSYRYDNAQLGGVEDGNKQFLSFLVEEDASGFSLRFVRDGEDVSLDLGL